MRDKIIKLLKSTAIEAALRSGRYIRRSVGKTISISHKGIGNIVTDVDKRSEDIIVGVILSKFSQHAILAEEREPVKSSSSYKWIIDPIDGTTNFAHAFPFFSVSIALEKDGDILLGVVFDPMREELFYAEKGNGSFLNGRRIRVSNIHKIGDALLATGFPYDIDRRLKNIPYFKNFLLSSCAIRRAGSASLDICYVACGRFDGFWEMDLKPWDTAAGLLILNEAGGIVTSFNGDKYSIYKDEMVAGNKAIHKQMLDLIKMTTK